jgi:hypothetical protein
MSVLVHPDKNPGPEAREAFERLNEAHRLLKDQGKLVGAAAGVAQGRRVAGQNVPVPSSAQVVILHLSAKPGCRV